MAWGGYTYFYDRIDDIAKRDFTPPIIERNSIVKQKKSGFYLEPLPMGANVPVGVHVILPVGVENPSRQSFYTVHRHKPKRRK